MQMLNAYLALWAGIVLPVSMLRALDSLIKYASAQDIALAYLLALAATLSVAASVWFGVDVACRMLCIRSERAQETRTLAHLCLLFCFLIALLVGPVTLWLAAVARTELMPGQISRLALCAIFLGGCFIAIRRHGREAIRRRLLQLVQQLVSAARWIGICAAGAALVVTVVNIRWTTAATATTVAATPSVPRPNIVLITLDTFSALHSELYGHTRVTTPHLSALAAESATFDYAYAACNFTTPSLVSIHTGTYPWTHRVLTGEGYVQRERRALTLPAILATHGYETAAFTANWWASPEHHMTDAGYEHVSSRRSSDVMGIRLGPWAGWDLDRLRAVFPFNLVGPALQAWVDRLRGIDGTIYPYPPAVVYDEAEQFLDRRDTRRPFFLWVHTMPPHGPHLPPHPHRERFLAGDALGSIDAQSTALRQPEPQRTEAAAQLSLRYDELLSYADEHLGRFIAALRRRGLLDTSILIVTSDHGESFERGIVGHRGPQLYDNLMRVPLLIRVPNTAPRTRIAVPVSHVDLMPTVIDYATTADLGRIDGRSLRPLLEGRTSSLRPVYAMNVERSSAFGPLTTGTIAVVAWPLKYIKYLKQPGYERNELFDLSLDSSERANLIETRSSDAARLESLLLQHLGNVE